MDSAGDLCTPILKLGRYEHRGLVYLWRGKDLQLLLVCRLLVIARAKHWILGYDFSEFLHLLLARFRNNKWLLVEIAFDI